MYPLQEKGVLGCTCPTRVRHCCFCLTPHQVDHHHELLALNNATFRPFGQAHRTPCLAPTRRGRRPKTTPIPVAEEEEADEGGCGDVEADAAEGTGKLCPV